jgi:hypothetical protein
MHPARRRLREFKVPPSRFTERSRVRVCQDHAGEAQLWASADRCHQIVPRTNHPLRVRSPIWAMRDELRRGICHIAAGVNAPVNDPAITPLVGKLCPGPFFSTFGAVPILKASVCIRMLPDHSHRSSPARQGGGAGNRAGLHDVGDRAVVAGNGHSAQGIASAVDHRFCGCGHGRGSHRRLHLQLHYVIYMAPRTTRTALHALSICK